MALVELFVLVFLWWFGSTIWLVILHFIDTWTIQTRDNKEFKTNNQVSSSQGKNSGDDGFIYSAMYLSMNDD